MFSVFRNIKIVFTALWLMIFFIAAGIGPNTARADYPCATGAAVPAFLTEGVDPNLLVIIDNSASMLDLAYVDDASTCFDDSYADTTTYAGYFDPDTWYYYYAVNEKYYAISDSDASTFCAGADTEYSSDYLCIDGTITSTGSDDELTGVNYLIATGNLLNWLAASKIDIQKQILTGGKYENSQLKMESRGCGDRRFIKKVPVTYDTTDTHYVTFAVRPPVPQTFDDWEDGASYTTGDIVDDGTGNLWQATSTGTADGYDRATDVGVTWTEYWGTRWHAGTAYTAGDLVTDPSDSNTIDEGKVYIATTSGTAAGTDGVDGDTGVDWEPYDLTHIEVYAGNDQGFDNTACQAAVDELNSANPSQGQLMNDIDDCMGTQRYQGSAGSADANNAFNHGIHNCWYKVKHGEWQSGSGPETSMKSACEAIYESGIDPWELTPSDRAYVCYGQNPGGSSDDDTSDDVGYVGRCWLAGSSGTGDYTGQWQCTRSGDTYPDDCPEANKQEFVWIDGDGNEPPDYAKNTTYTTGDVVLDRNGDPYEAQSDGESVANFLADDTGVEWAAYGTSAGWTSTDEGYGEWDTGDNPGSGTLDDCIRWAMADFCSGMEVPEVIDPSDQVGSATGESDVTWGLPAILTDSGVVAQLGDAIYTMKGFIEQSSAPEGLIQEFDDDIRMGAMTFNDNGSKYECDNPDSVDPYVLYECSSSNKDGGKIISEIGQSSTHTDDLVEAINDIKATSWTPLAEAMFNAIGYYAQDTSFRLNTTDFTTGTDPVLAYCQDNNTLIITEGASTADKSSTMTAFTAGSGNNDADTSDTTYDCGTLDGSTLLDDLTYYAKNDDTFMGTMADADGVQQDKQNISTHIVVAGTLRDDGTTDECNPSVLLNSATSNGGTTLYTAADPSALESTLREAFSAIRAGAAAGSAASVISASRGGEGATYQAIFFPTVELTGGGSVDWTGEVHALLVDSEGNLYEDTNSDRTLDTTADQRVIFFFDEDENKTKVCRNGEVTSGSCSGTEIELEDVKYLWSAAEWLSEIPPVNDADSGLDITYNRSSVPTPYSTAGDYISSTKKRYIFTWSDLDNDGIVDDAELLDFDEDTDWAGLTVNSTTSASATYRAPVPYDFGVQTNAEVDEIVNWVRGLDQSGMRERLMPYAFGGGTESDIYWRLGDVIHSTPISVAGPSEGFHLLYRDSSYAEFVSDYKARRHVIYYGGNDGMLHAVNGGFYSETDKKFCKTSNCLSESAAPELGAELWAYVPYNLLGHLKCLTETDYTDQHKYYVDQRVRVFDMRIFDSTDGIHTQGWGTVMVAAMRFGGAKIYPGTLDLDGNTVADYPGDRREFTSAYMIFDITDPERPPVLLAEMTKTTHAVWADMGYTTPIPTAVTFKTGTSTSDTSWYLIFGSGPTDLDGTSTQDAKVAVLPMDWITGSTKRAFRIPDVVPAGASNYGGVFTISGSVFASDLVTVDFEIDANYMSDAVYFGTLSGDWYDASSNPDGWGGGLWRLVTRAIDSDGNQYEIDPSSWSLHHLIDTEQPVTASPALGTDGKNFWVYFGTGRFLASNDKLDPEVQSYYGIKEPMTFATTTGGDCVGTLTWDTVERTGAGSTPGDQGLTDVSLIDVYSDGTLGGSGIPSGVTTFDELVDHIVGTGTGCEGSPDYGTDGWVKDFQLDKERNIGQATLLGGLLTFTTYQPATDQCSAEGVSYLYGVYYQTGTAYSQGVFLSAENPEGIDESGDTVIQQVSLGRGLATTPNLHVGKHEGSKAFVQTSTGEIVEVPQPNLPLESYKTGRISWGEIK